MNKLCSNALKFLVKLKCSQLAALFTLAIRATKVKSRDNKDGTLGFQHKVGGTNLRSRDTEWLVVTEGRPRVVREIVDDAKAIIMGYLPGMEGGRAIADVLLGDVNPSGKLPFSYPRYSGWHTWYDHKPSEAHSPNRVSPQWPFGYGLSYTSYAYTGLRLDKERLSKGDLLSVAVDVKNTGRRKGKEIVHLYLSDLVASVTPPVKAVKGFQKATLEPGETETVRFELTWDDFSFIGRDNKPVVERGEFRIRIGDLTETFVVESGSFQVNP